MLVVFGESCEGVYETSLSAPCVGGTGEDRGFSERDSCGCKALRSKIKNMSMQIYGDVVSNSSAVLWEVRRHQKREPKWTPDLGFAFSKQALAHENGGLFWTPEIAPRGPSRIASRWGQGLSVQHVSWTAACTGEIHEAVSCQASSRALPIVPMWPRRARPQCAGLAARVSPPGRFRFHNGSGFVASGQISGARKDSYSWVS